MKTLRTVASGAAALLVLLAAATARASELDLDLPDFESVQFLGNVSGRNLLMSGLVVCALGLIFGLVIYKQLKNLQVHKAMLEVSELIYETCKTDRKSVV